MAEFKSFKALDKYLKKAVKSAIKDEPPKAVKNLMKKHILHDVYMVYKPKQYIRRYNNQGLMDERNIKIENKRNNIVHIYNVAKRKDYYPNLYLAPIIEYGYEKARTKGVVGVPKGNPNLKYYDKRPFVENTRKSLKKSKSHIKAFQYGLKKFGINSKLNGT